MYVYTYVCIYVFIILHTIAGRIYKKTANKNCLCKGDRSSEETTLYLLFLCHLSVFTYSKIHRYVYLYIETNLKKIKGKYTYYTEFYRICDTNLE